eukprot:GSMAST32.ASY1.ANO1.206.1 assembled CDS
MTSLQGTGHPINTTPMFPPSSLATSTPEDESSSRLLRLVLDEEAPLESNEQRKHRQLVLAELLRITQTWVSSIARENGLGEFANEAGGKICVSGSFRLGVNSPDGDIDAICLVPKYINRTHFFDSYLKFLENDPNATDIVPIDQARIPIIGLVYRGVEIDLLLASLPRNTVPTDLSIEDPSILLPHWENFKIVLRSIRLWSKRRSIFSNKMGYLGGINCAILAAFVCQQFPNKSPSRLLRYFFNLFSKWQWPTPLNLCKPTDHELGFEQWESSNPLNRRHLMPIITPCYPVMNSMYTASKSSMHVMGMEIERCNDLTQSIFEMQLEFNETEAWRNLFSTYCFPAEFDHFICIELAAKDEKSFLSWQGYSESQIRHFIDGMSYMPLKVVRPFPKKFDGPAYSSQSNVNNDSNIGASDNHGSKTSHVTSENSNVDGSPKNTSDSTVDVSPKNTSDGGSNSTVAGSPKNTSDGGSNSNVDEPPKNASDGSNAMSMICSCYYLIGFVIDKKKFFGKRLDLVKATDDFVKRLKSGPVYNDELHELKPQYLSFKNLPVSCFKRFGGKDEVLQRRKVRKAHEKRLNSAARVARELNTKLLNFDHDNDVSEIMSGENNASSTLANIMNEQNTNGDINILNTKDNVSKGNSESNSPTKSNTVLSAAMLLQQQKARLAAGLSKIESMRELQARIDIAKATTLAQVEELHRKNEWQRVKSQTVMRMDGEIGDSLSNKSEFASQNETSKKRKVVAGKNKKIKKGKKKKMKLSLIK